jgi:transposase
MAGKSPVKATDEQEMALKGLAGGMDRAEADRARAVLLTLDGWTSGRIAKAFGVREDTVRFWRSEFMRGGIDALKVSVAPGPAPLKAEAALRVAGPLLLQPIADRTNWTLARLADEIAAKEGIKISRSQLSKVLRKKGDFVSGGRGTH